MKTIRRNSKRAKRVFDQATGCDYHEICSGFKGFDAIDNLAEIWNEYQSSPSARLIETGPGEFLLKQEPNLFYHIESPA